MTDQFKAFRFSIYVHAVCLILIMAAGRSIERSAPPIIIDFSLETLRPALRAQTPAAPKAQPVKKDRPVVRKAVRKTEPTVPKSEPKPVLAETPPREPAPVVPDPEPLVAEAVTTDLSAPTHDYAADVDTTEAISDGTVAEDRAVGLSAEEILEGTRSIYRLEHFIRIRDMIVQKIRYPVLARRLGLEGQVKVSFIVCRNGDVKEVKIQESSGAPILDDQAVKAVMQASPFPGPPVEVQLVVPITYKLS